MVTGMAACLLILLLPRVIGGEINPSASPTSSTRCRYNPGPDITLDADPHALATASICGVADPASSYAQGRWVKNCDETSATAASTTQGVIQGVTPAAFDPFVYAGYDTRVTGNALSDSISTAWDQ